jgi:TolA-binding protein
VIKTESDLTFKEKLSIFLHRNWKIGVVIAAVLIVAVIAAAVVDRIDQNRKFRSAILAEEIQNSYVTWSSAGEEERDTDTLDTLIDEAISDYSKDFAAQRGLFTRGLMAAESDQWEDAAVAFKRIVDQWPESYLAPVSLFNLGSVLEEKGDLDGAADAWRSLVDEYGDVAPDTPEALFHLGRIAEGRGDDAEAMEIYNEVESRYPGSRWTNFAKNRILLIESRG